MSLLLSFGYAVIFTSLIFYLSFRFSRRRLYKLSEPLAGFTGLPLIGNAHQFAGGLGDITRTLYNVIDICYKNDGLAKVWLGPKLYVVVTDPTDAENILNNELTKDSIYHLLRVWVGSGLISADVPVWRVHRRTINPSFNQKILDETICFSSEQAQILVKKLSAEVDKEQFNVYNYISPCTLDIICESAMGVKIKAQENPDTPYIQSGIRVMRLIYKRLFQIWLQPNMIYSLTPYYKEECKDIKILHAFTDDVIKRKREELNNRKGLDYDTRKYKPFLELMMELPEKGKPLTDVEIREEVDTLTITANDSSAHAVSYILLMLGSHPEIQQKVVDELNEIFGDSDRPVEKKDLGSMQYLERVFKETMRLFPIIPIIVREVTKEIQLRNLRLPVGAGVVVAICGMHRDEKIWGKDVLDFNPDRFLPENVAKRPKNCYIPFSSGPRNCIGQQYAMYSVKTITATILRTYKVHSDLNYKTMPVHAEFILKPVNGHLISIEQRHKH